MMSDTQDSRGCGPPAIILASASPRRRELFALLGLPFRAGKAEVDESSHPRESPQEMAARLALSKARAVAGLYQVPVVGCDTVVTIGGESLGKPLDAEEARRMLASLRGRTHTVYTGIAVVGKGHEVVQVVETPVTMRDYTNQELGAYIASGDPLDKAGAYGIQHPTFRPVASWEGCYANVMGLPLCHLARALGAWSITPPADVPTACQAHTGQPCRAFRTILPEQSVADAN